MADKSSKRLPEPKLIEQIKATVERNENTTLLRDFSIAMAAAGFTILLTEGLDRKWIGTIAGLIVFIFGFAGILASLNNLKSNK